MENYVENIGANVPAERDIETITIEINYLKGKAGEAILEIGKRLIEAKEQLAHGEWLPWLNEKVQFSEKAAQNFMRLAKEWSNPQTLADLGTSKALQLLALGPVERDEFMSEKHDINGSEKTVESMTNRELADAIKARKEAEQTAEELSKKTADQAMQIKDLEAMLEDEKNRVKEITVTEIQKDEEAEKALRMEIDALSLKLKTAKKESDTEKKEIEARLAAKSKALDDEKKRSADAAQKIREEAEAAFKAQLDEQAAKLSKLENQLKESGSADVAVFKVHFEAVQAEAEELSKIIAKLAEEGRPEAEKLKAAYKAVLESLINNI